jgi:hypothetical protein
MKLDSEFVAPHGGFVKPCLNASRLAASLLVLTATLVHGQGIIVEHTGSNNPTNEGFSRIQVGPGSTGPITGDLGMNAWQVIGSGPNSEISYNYLLTPQQQAETLGANWIFSITLRSLQPFSGDFVDLLGTSNELVMYPDSWLNGDTNGYHNFQLDYNAGSDMVSLWIDGTEENTNYLDSYAVGGIKEIDWGVTQGFGRDNWNLVSFSVPEPSAEAIAVVGGGILFYLHRKHAARERKQRPANRKIPDE